VVASVPRTEKAPAVPPKAGRPDASLERLLYLGVTGALLVGTVDFALALRPAFAAGARGGDLAWQIASLMLVAGLLLGLAQWLIVRSTMHFGRARDGLRALGLSVCPSAFLLLLLVQRWSAIGWAARLAFVGAIATGQVGALVVVRVVSRWRQEPRKRALLARSVIVLVSLAAFGATYAADRLVLPRLYRPFHDALAFSTLLVAESVALSLGDAIPAAVLRRYGRIAAVVVGLLVILPGVRRAGGLGRDRALSFAIFEHTNVAGRSLALARAVVDRDGDGYSSILGGGDCDDRDPRAHPGALDLPENGIDEDCSGADTRVEDLGAAAGAAPPPVHGRFDVLLLSVDALRADHLGAFGYRRPTSPNLDALAKRALFFERAHSQSNNTAASLPSLLTGRYPSTSPWAFDVPESVGPGWAHLTDEANVTLAEILRDAGWATSVFTDKIPLSGLGLQQGFQYVRAKHADQDEALLQHVASLGDRRWFAWVHFDEPHALYEVHPGFDFGKSDIDRYDSEVAFVDARIGRILRWLDESGRAKSTIVVVTADHGEEFGDHGGSQHASTLYEEQIHVPLLVLVPGVPPRRVTQPAELVDILPTLLSVLDIPVPEVVDGRSLFALLGSGEPESAYSEHYNGTVLKRALVGERWKLISNTAANTLELYDLERDPSERANVIGRDPELSGRLERQLESFSERKTLFALALARRHGGAELDALARRLHLVERPELLAECVRVLAAGAATRSNGAWEEELARLAQRPSLSVELRVDIARALEHMNGVWSIRGLAWLAGNADPTVSKAALAALDRRVPSAPHPYKWPERAERAPEVSHLDFGTRHGDWQVVAGIGKEERLGVRATAWSRGDRTRVAFWIPAPGPRPGRWVLEADAWAHPDAPGGRASVRVTVNGRDSGSFELGKELTRASLEVDSGVLRAGANFVDFEYPATFGPDREAVRWSFAMLFPARPTAFDAIAGQTTSRVKWTSGWERLGLWRGATFLRSHGRRAELSIPLDPAAGDYRLRMDVVAPEGTAAKPTVDASINGHPVGRAEIGTDWTAVELDVPHADLIQGDNVIVLEIATSDGAEQPLLSWHAFDLAPRPAH
jgi:arylsulfatase A-like enzyme